MSEKPKQHLKKKEKKRSRVRFQGQICMGTLSPQRFGLADVTAPGVFAFSPPLGAGIQVYLPAGTGRTPLRLLRFVCRRAPGSFSCMLDILLNTSFLDDMGDHSKSKFVCLFSLLLTQMRIFLCCLIRHSRPACIYVCSLIK